MARKHAHAALITCIKVVAVKKPASSVIFILVFLFYMLANITWIYMPPTPVISSRAYNWTSRFPAISAKLPNFSASP